MITCDLLISMSNLNHSVLMIQNLVSQKKGSSGRLLPVTRGASRILLMVTAHVRMGKRERFSPSSWPLSAETLTQSQLPFSPQRLTSAPACPGPSPPLRDTALCPQG